MPLKRLKLRIADRRQLRALRAWCDAMDRGEPDAELDELERRCDLAVMAAEAAERAVFPQVYALLDDSALQEVE